MEFISSPIKRKQENESLDATCTDKNSKRNSGEINQIDVASDITLIIGKNDAGKTTIIKALDNLINHSNAFGVNDFNFRYLQSYLGDYDVFNPKQEHHL